MKERRQRFGYPRDMEVFKIENGQVAFRGPNPRTPMNTSNEFCVPARKALRVGGAKDNVVPAELPALAAISSEDSTELALMA